MRRILTAVVVLMGLAYAGAQTNGPIGFMQLFVTGAAAASSPPATINGTWFSGGSSTTTKPQLLIEPTGTTSTGWRAAGTGLGINAASGFVGDLISTGVNGTYKWSVGADGTPRYQGTTPTASSGTVTGSNSGGFVAGLTAATTVTLTFGGSPWGTWAACTATPSTTGVTVYNSAQSTTAVTFSMAALTGTLYYTCVGN